MKFLCTILLIAFTLGYATTYAQIDDVKKRSKQNQSKRDKQKGGSSSSGSTNGCFNNSECMGDCFSVCAGACASFVTDALIDAQMDYIDDRKKIPRMISLDIYPHFGYIVSDDDYTLLPRIRGNWAMFSTDVRYFNWVEFDSSKFDFYSTLDWQVIQFNPFITKNFTFRIGTGFMYENYSKTYFNEHFIGTDVVSDNRHIQVNVEGRWAIDYQTAKNVRIEGNARFNYRVMGNSSVDGYWMFGALYQNYYSEVDIYGIQTGFSFNIH